MSGWLHLNEVKRTIDELTIQLCTQERENKEENLKGDFLNQESLEVKTSLKTVFKGKKQTGRCNYF